MFYKTSAAGGSCSIRQESFRITIKWIWLEGKQEYNVVWMGFGWLRIFLKP